MSTSETVEKGFKFVFGLAIFVAGLIVIGLFLLLLKVLLLFYPDIFIMGIHITAG